MYVAILNVFFQNYRFLCFVNRMIKGYLKRKKRKIIKIGLNKSVEKVFYWKIRSNIKKKNNDIDNFMLHNIPM